MVPSSKEAQRPAPEQDAPTSSAERKFSLRDGVLTVTLFSKPRSKGGESQFVIPERSYRDESNKWVNTHILHVEDLLPMAQLLTDAYRQLRTAPSDRRRE